MSSPSASSSADAVPDVCVVGAGPLGIALALACRARGLSVLLLESGTEDATPEKAALSEARILDERRHAAMSVAVRRALGGTSRWWGGRCVPYDDVDFESRPFALDAAWPIGHGEIRPWYQAAAEFFGCGPAHFATEATRYDDAQFDQLERWTPEIDMSVRHAEALRGPHAPELMLDATVVGLILNKDGRAIDGLSVKTASGVQTIRARRYVLASGGLETLRLLLATQAQHPNLFGPELGAAYMGHISGKIADLQLRDPTSVGQHDFFLEDGAFARRRFTLARETQLREGVLNTSFWIDNPPFHNAAHRSGVLSAVWLALASPLGGRLLSPGVRLSHVGPKPHQPMKHVANILGQPFQTLGTIIEILRARYGRPRKPGFLIRNSAGRYALHYHAEQAPNLESRVSLSAEQDAYGLPRLEIDLRYSEKDVDSVLRSHELLDQSLRQAGVGELIYREPPERRRQSVWDQATDGFHQVGGARMAADAKSGVVDKDCRLFDLSNVYLASTCVFPSSGQANPTFLGVALALRLAEHLAVTTIAGNAKSATPSARHRTTRNAVMRQVFAEALGREVSALGFGCASLGSRVSAAEGLSALARAYDHGVTWFDVAPPYGDGAAETLLGQFVKGKRDQIAICTKVGIEAPQLSMKAKLLKPVMRTALKLAPQLREAVARRRPASVRAPIDAKSIEASVTRSLKNLGVDYVDVLALHEPALDDVQREDVRGALQAMVDKGYARIIGIAGDRPAAEQGVAAFPLYRMVQHADGPFEPPLTSHGALRVTHSVFGVGGALSKLTQAVATDEGLRVKLAEFGFTGSSSEIAATALMDFALSNNTSGVVLASMFRPEHLAFNIDRANRSPNPELVGLLQSYDWTAR
jgi:aryl-alcohol dehydrogenase-like predicted oxidoreductase